MSDLLYQDVLSYQDVEDAQQKARDTEAKYLNQQGWEYTSRTVDCRRRWVKKFRWKSSGETREMEYTCNRQQALEIERYLRNAFC